MGGNTTQATTQATQTNNRCELSEIELKILGEIKSNSRISQSDISKETGIDVNTVKYYVKRLKEKNIIAREGTSQKGCWKIIG